MYQKKDIDLPNAQIVLPFPKQPFHFWQLSDDIEIILFICS